MSRNHNSNGDVGEITPEKEKNTPPTPEISKKFKRKSKKNTAVKFIAVFCAVILFLSGGVFIFIGSKFDKMGTALIQSEDESAQNEENSQNAGENDSSDAENEKIEDIYADFGSEDFRQALKIWANTGNDKKLKDKNIYNLLLIGVDSREGKNQGNSDVILLISLNKNTKKINLVSFLRDSYCYIDAPNGGYFGKINSAYSAGGAKCLMETVENNYKITVDNYVLVNFQSFKAIIDKMGGVTLQVKRYEAEYLNKNMGQNISYGENVTLNGEEALHFCRLRASDNDADVSRTGRQRRVINAIINRAKSATIGELNSYIDEFLPYVATDLTRKQVFSLGFNALKEGYLGYSVEENQIPTPESRISGDVNAWIWVIDYELSAQTLQNTLYGRSNIVLSENRKSIISIFKEGKK